MRDVRGRWVVGIARAVSWSGWRVTVVADGWIGIREERGRAQRHLGGHGCWLPPLRCASGCRRGGVAEWCATFEGGWSSASLGRCRGRAGGSRWSLKDGSESGNERGRAQRHLGGHGCWLPPLRCASGCRRGGVAEWCATFEGSGSSASLGRCRGRAGGSRWSPKDGSGSGNDEAQALRSIGAPCWPRSFGRRWRDLREVTTSTADAFSCSDAPMPRLRSRWSGIGGEGSVGPAIGRVRRDRGLRVKAATVVCERAGGAGPARCLPWRWLQNVSPVGVCHQNQLSVVVCMVQPVRWVTPWWAAQSPARFSMSVGPPFSQRWRWWKWVAGRQQPGKTQRPPSRTMPARRCLVWARRLVRPSLRGLSSASTRTGSMVQSHRRVAKCSRARCWPVGLVNDHDTSGSDGQAIPVRVGQPGGVVVGLAEHEADPGADGVGRGGGEVAVADELVDGVAAELGSGEGGDVGGLFAVFGLAAEQFVGLVVDDLFEDLGVLAGELGAEQGVGPGSGPGGFGVGRVGGVGAVLVEAGGEVDHGGLPVREHPPVGQVDQVGLGGGDPVADPRVGRGDEHLDVFAADGPVEPRLVGGVEVGAQHPGDLDLAEPDVGAHPGAVTEPGGGGLPVAGVGVAGLVERAEGVDLEVIGELARGAGPTPRPRTASRRRARHPIDGERCSSASMVVELVGLDHVPIVPRGCDTEGLHSRESSELLRNLFHACWRAVVTIIGVIAERGFRCTVGDLAVLRGKGRLRSEVGDRTATDPHVDHPRGGASGRAGWVQVGRWSPCQLSPQPRERDETDRPRRNSDRLLQSCSYRPLSLRVP